MKYQPGEKPFAWSGHLSETKHCQCVLASQEGITILYYRRMVDAVYSQAPAHFTAAAVLPHLRLQPLLANQQYAGTVAVIGFVVQSAACPANHQKPVQMLPETHSMSVLALSTAASVI